MATHFGTAKHSGVDAPEWLKVGTHVAELVNEWSLRGDLIVRIGPNESAPAPALYNPALSEVEVNTTHAFGRFVEPDLVGDLTDRDTQFDWPKATGAILHEALHARFTRWSLVASAARLTESQNAALHLLEESRIEGLGVQVMPKNRGFLRACALEIVLGDLNPDELAKQGTTRAAAHVTALTLARVDAGVLDRADVELAAEHCETILGPELLGKLRDIWTQFQAHTDHASAEQLYPLAIEWDRLVTETAEERGEGGEGGEIPQEVIDAIRELIEKLSDDASGTALSAGGELGDQQQSEDWAAQAKGKSADAKQLQDHKTSAEKVFSKASGPGEARTNSQLRQRRQPTSAERAAAVQVARMLEKAKYRERGQTQVTSVTPPGRLRPGAMVQAAALKSKGVRSQVEPWRRTVRKHTDNPELRVGVMVDISGSMSAAMEPMATTAWVMSEAVRRISGKTAMVYYGNDVFPTLKPGQHLREVNVYSANDGTEKFNEAFKALDGSMNLLQGSGARLLVVVSDGEYTSDQRPHADAWMKACHRAGVAVLWINYSRYNHYPAQYLAGTDGQLVSTSGDAVEAAKLIGEAAAKALTRVGARVGA